MMFCAEIMSIAETLQCVFEGYEMQNIHDGAPAGTDLQVFSLQFAVINQSIPVGPRKLKNFVCAIYSNLSSWYRNDR